MHECLLCKKDMKASNDTFGNGCIKNIYKFLELEMPKKVKLRENTLFNSIMRLNSQNYLNKNQKVWLTDRYLTLQYLNRVPYGNYERLKKQMILDIQNIKQLKEQETPKSSKLISLKNAYDLFKKATKFTEGIERIKEGNFTDEESIRLFIASFSYIFNFGKNKKQYEKDSFKAMQYAFWQAVIEDGGKYVGFDIAADFLQHSLEKSPANVKISHGKVVQAIIEDENFKSNINNIINEYGKTRNQFLFDSNLDNRFPMTFGEKDLYFAIHDVELKVEGKRQKEKWILNIKLHDRYDYSRRKTLLEHYNDVNSIPKSIISSTLYNLAYYSIKFGVMKEYDIDIQFKITDEFEVVE